MIATVFRRTWAISKAETSLYVRNRSIALTALLFTPLLVLVSSQDRLVLNLQALPSTL
mgnify:CR=1 FL=1